MEISSHQSKTHRKPRALHRKSSKSMKIDQKKTNENEEATYKHKKTNTKQMKSKKI